MVAVAVAVVLVVAGGAAIAIAVAAISYCWSDDQWERRGVSFLVVVFVVVVVGGGILTGRCRRGGLGSNIVPRQTEPSFAKGVGLFVIACGIAVARHGCHSSSTFTVESSHSTSTVLVVLYCTAASLYKKSLFPQEERMTNVYKQGASFVAYCCRSLVVQ